MSLISRIAHALEQITPGPVTKTVEEQLRPIHDGRIGPDLNSHAHPLVQQRGWEIVPADGALVPCLCLQRNNSAERSCTDPSRTLYNVSPFGVPLREEPIHKEHRCPPTPFSTKYGSLTSSVQSRTGLPYSISIVSWSTK